MKNILCLVLLGLAAVTSLTSFTVFAAEPSEDAKALLGNWVPVKGEFAGDAMPDEILKAITLKIENGTYVVTVKGEEMADKGTWTVDPTANPKSMDAASTEGPNAGKKFLAIYELKGDTFRVCYDLSGTKRPTEFKTAADTQLYLVTYERKK
jgi:uncharacterized protein (TIGR03067 family)